MGIPEKIQAIKDEMAKTHKQSHRASCRITKSKACKAKARTRRGQIKISWKLGRL